MTAFSRLLPRRLRRRRGAMLILTLWLILLLAVMAYSLTYELRVGLKMTSLGRHRLKAYGLARAGLAKGVVDLRNDRLAQIDMPSNSADTPEDIWADTRDKTDVELGEGTYTVRVVDETAKLDVSHFTPKMMPALVYLLKEISRFDDKEAETIAQALLDYQDFDIYVQGRMSELENDYYTEWGLKEFGRRMPEGWTFKARNDRLMNIEELLGLPGLTPKILYGDPLDVPSDPLDRVEWLSKHKRSPALADYITAGGRGLVNVNTCPVEVIEAIAWAALQGGRDCRTVAQQIDDFRRDRIETGNDLGGIGVINLGNLTQSGVSQQTLAAMTQVVPFHVQSFVFTITSRGRVRGVSVTLQAEIESQLEIYPLVVDGRERNGLRDPRAEGELRIKPGSDFEIVVRARQLREL